MISKKFDVDFNLRAGGVQTVGGEEIGTMYVDIICSDPAKLPEVISALRGAGLIVEEVKK